LCHTALVRSATGVSVRRWATSMFERAIAKGR
jgi:hypothetical protein